MSAPRTPRHRLRRRLIAIVAGAAVLGAAWYLLAPPALGGHTTYVVTDGISMHPRIHTGDLALVRPAGAYRVGDIVAYRSPQLHVTVLHRIVRITPGGRYVMKGDNNSWLDPGRITRADIAGRLWVLAPGMGGRLRELRSPAAMAIMAAVAALLLLGGARSRVRRRRRRPQPKWKTPPPRPSARVAPSFAGVAVATGAAVACAALAAVAWTTPASRTAPGQVGYRQSGQFTYTAASAAGAVYSTGRVTTGQPVFSRLVGPVRVQFDYALAADVPGRLRGTASLGAVVAAPNGWSRTIALADPAPFRGRTVSVTGIVHLRRLQRLLQQVGDATQVPGTSFTLTLVPLVHVRGTLAGAPFHAGYAPQLPFTLTPLELSPAQPEQAAGHASSRPAAMFHPVQDGSFTSMRSAPVSVGVGRLRLPDTVVRVAALAGLLLALAAVALTATRLRRDRRADEATRIHARYGETIVHAVGSTLASERDLVEVQTMEALGKLAERYDSLIIHEQVDSHHAYLVTDAGTVYAYFVPVADAPAAPAADARERRPQLGVSSTRAA
jgi:signal peptidase I